MLHVTSRREAHPLFAALGYALGFGLQTGSAVSDADSFDLGSTRKSCIHIAHPDGKSLIPFDTLNRFYRDDLEQTGLAPLQQ